jgi:hypothetical protein
MNADVENEIYAGITTGVTRARMFWIGLSASDLIARNITVSPAKSNPSLMQLHTVLTSPTNIAAKTVFALAIPYVRAR